MRPSEKRGVETVAKFAQRRLSKVLTRHDTAKDGKEAFAVQVWSMHLGPSAFIATTFSLVEHKLA